MLCNQLLDDTNTMFGEQSLVQIKDLVGEKYTASQNRNGILQGLDLSVDLQKTLKNMNENIRRSNLFIT